MGRELVLVDLDDLVPHPDNPKDHDVALLAKSVERFGFVEPIVRDTRSGFMVSGHGRRDTLIAMREKGAQAPDGVVADETTWLVPVIEWTSRSDAEVRTLLVTLNRAGERGGWDAEALTEVLKTIQGDGLLELAGFSETELSKLLLSVEPRPSGELLARSDVTMGEPDHEATSGDHFTLDGRHHLFVLDVMRDWSTWAPFLEGDVLFVPYPGPYIALSLLSQKHAMVMVQPEPFIAAHILDKFTAIVGDDKVTKAS